MTNDHKPRRRVLIPLLVAALGITLGAGGIALLHPLNQATPPQLASTAATGGGRAPARPLSAAAIRARVEPSIVDVTGTLTYDDETASGTGFVIDAARQFILTNNHVVRDATSVAVSVPATGQSYPARIVGVDVAADIAVLQISPAVKLPGAPLGNSGAVTTGTPVTSFGNQAGAGGEPAVASGVISATGRTIEANDGASGFSETLHGMLATTARIEPGDSGGPLASAAGIVIGVDTAAGAGNAATGYAIPIATALAAERQISAGHRGPGITIGTGGFLGVLVGPGAVRSPAAQSAAGLVNGRSVPTVTTASLTASCLPVKTAVRAPSAVARVASGALVDAVLCGSGAASAGISAGDVITAAGGRQIVSARALTGLISASRPGTVVSVSWVAASGARRTALIRLTQAPAV